MITCSLSKKARKEKKFSPDISLQKYFFNSQCLHMNFGSLTFITIMTSSSYPQCRKSYLYFKQMKKVWSTYFILIRLNILYWFYIYILYLFILQEIFYTIVRTHKVRVYELPTYGLKSIEFYDSGIPNSNFHKGYNALQFIIDEAVVTERLPGKSPSLSKSDAKKGVWAGRLIGHYLALGMGNS